MYFAVIPKQLIDERGVFTDAPQLTDGSRVVSMSDIMRFTRFSYGTIQLLNETDAIALINKGKTE